MQAPPYKREYFQIIFLFLNQNICCGYSKEPSHGDGSFEHPELMFRLIGKKLINILCTKLFLIRICSYVIT